jgi:hypothetical protein
VRTLAGAHAASDALIDIRPDGDVRILMAGTGADFHGAPERVAHLRRFCWGPSV